ncbi:hypothetical protein NUW58_g10278 [Xylaria curta]|uniref:Uncharacterized protein n=1 Tax=Xylaria curta TaxID=42375 RepID=A0ACC1MPI0_9PEZI|nr:hypothetical protein NUW58_g10278 [Xylaria curta]
MMPPRLSYSSFISEAATSCEVATAGVSAASSPVIKAEELRAGVSRAQIRFKQPGYITELAHPVSQHLVLTNERLCFGLVIGSLVAEARKMRLAL